ncbi:hypothetical protein Rsub_02484 [Raphidocelis subcapitata]|uniref:Chromo domain-containing protein n=1 Tax=Raphidocelis subcapitata TaxID=307507 RepID=A0A2V0NRT0_9CHLO|nr:hypothetical protein Rsub_02484 [Raphidocelis subcapitata]|eukprot:GBF90378.1 hypothetical protein Rsub_02484 [Raphidocelis subcapitata]
MPPGTPKRGGASEKGPLWKTYSSILTGRELRRVINGEEQTWVVMNQVSRLATLPGAQPDVAALLGLEADADGFTRYENIYTAAWRDRRGNWQYPQTFQGATGFQAVAAKELPGMLQDRFVDHPRLPPELRERVLPLQENNWYPLPDGAATPRSARRTAGEAGPSGARARSPEPAAPAAPAPQSPGARRAAEAPRKAPAAKAATGRAPIAAAAAAAAPPPPSPAGKRTPGRPRTAPAGGAAEAAEEEEAEATPAAGAGGRGKKRNSEAAGPSGKKSAGRAAAPAAAYVGLTGRTYPTELAFKKGDRRVDDYADEEAEGEYEVDCILDEAWPNELGGQPIYLIKWKEDADAALAQTKWARRLARA